MTENEKKLLDQVLYMAAVSGHVHGPTQDLIRAVQMERVSPMAREEYLRARIRYLRENHSFWETLRRLGLPDSVTDPLNLEAAEIVEDDVRTPAPEAMTPEKLKAYTGRDFDR